MAPGGRAPLEKRAADVGAHFVGRRTDRGEINAFRPGIGMMASRLHVPVVPVRLEGLDRVLHHSWSVPRPGRVRVTFGSPLLLEGDDFEALAKRVEDAVRTL